MSKTYSLEIEVAGNAAMWTRPDSVSAPVSYPAPTFSAVKGFFESILFQKSTVVVPIKTEICAPLSYQKYHTNYGGPLRKAEQIKKGNPYQLLATILINVCYRFYAEIKDLGATQAGRLNHQHAYQERFYRRIKKGQWFRTPCLGWSEFTPNYLGSFRDTTQVDEKINETLPSMLHTVFNKPYEGKVAPTFKQNVTIHQGVLTYAQ